MLDSPFFSPPELKGIESDAESAGFEMSCDVRTGSLLATLAASKPGGRLLELGTGAGAGAAWLLHGMDESARLTTVESDGTILDIARRHVGHDNRVTMIHQNANAFLDTYGGVTFDVAFIDCRPGKFERLSDLLSLLSPGAIFVGDDLLPQATWPEDHQERVDEFLASLPTVHSFVATPLAWASGLVIGSWRGAKS